MAHFTIRVEEDGGERRWARAEVGEGCTLDELDAWLARAFDPATGAWSFTLAGRRPGEESSFTGPGDDGLRPAQDVDVGALAWGPGARWIHRRAATPFRRRELLVEERLDGDIEGLRELERGAHGRSGGFDAERMAARAVQVAAQWERDLAQEREPEATELRARHALALELARWIGRDDDRQARIEELADGDGLLWVVDLPTQASEAGLHAEALELCAELDFVRGAQETRAERMFLLARAGRAGEALALAEAWRADEPEDGWVALHASDLFAIAGTGARAREELERAAGLDPDDLDLRIAVLERRAQLAREAGDERAALGFEDELEDAQLALEEGVEGSLGRIGRNEPCPCGSGMKYKRCCGADGGGGARDDASVVVELLEELAREADQPRTARALQEALPRFAGERLAGFALAAALPLLPRDDLPEALVHWAVLDCDLGDGTRVVERVLARRKRGGARERELLEQLARSATTVWRVEHLPGGRDARLVDQLDAAADPLVLRDAGDLPHGALVCARVLELDGEPALGPGTLLLQGEEAEVWLALLRERLRERRAAEPDLDWPSFLRRHACELYRPLAES